MCDTLAISSSADLKIFHLFDKTVFLQLIKGKKKMGVDHPRRMAFSN